jgi:RNA polymerase-binding transcription factor DksA
MNNDPMNPNEKWIEFIPIREGKVKCPRCGKEIGHQRIARGAHAARCIKQTQNDVHSPDFQSKTDAYFTSKAKEKDTWSRRSSIKLGGKWT